MALQALSGTITDYTWSVFSFFDNAVTLAGSPLAYETGYADDYLDDRSLTWL